jgi:thioesterase domain-containing protein/acyl carrier protein
MSQPSPAKFGNVAPRARAVEVERFPALRWYPQQQKWILEPETSDTVAYNYSLPLGIEGRLDPRLLELALEEIVRRHEVFRSCFEVRDGEQIQVITRPQRFSMKRREFGKLEPESRNLLTRKLALEDATQAFDLRFDPLLRGTLIEFSPLEHVLLLTTHHFVCDEWSASILIDELFKVYEAYALGKSSPLPPLSYSYHDFARRLGERLRKGGLAQQVCFWEATLQGRRDFYHLKADHPRRKQRISPARYCTSSFSTDVVGEIEGLGQRERVSPFMILLTAFHCALARVTGEVDLGIAACVANRDSTEVATLVGPFSNRILLRADLSDNPTFQEVLKRVRSQALDAYANQSIPFGEVVERIARVESSDRHPVFQVLMILEEVLPVAPEVPGLKICHFPFESPFTRYDLNVWLRIDTSKGLEVSLQYNSDLFEAATIERLLDAYSQVLKAMVGNREGRVHDVLSDETIHPRADGRVPHSEVSRAAPRDEIEKRLRKIWARSLAIEPTGIGVDQDYFELGGDSLKAAQLFNQIRKTFGVTLAISTLLEAGSVRALAERIREREKPSSKSLVRVQATGARLPLFCIHTHSGNVLFSRHFPKHMGPNQPIYGLQSLGVAGGKPHFTVNQMACHYREELKKIQPAGPYQLFGYSFGGLVAFEIAQLLSARGDQVVFLGMFNTPAPGSLTGWPLGQFAYLQKRVENDLEKVQKLEMRDKILRVLHYGGKFSRMIVRSAKADTWRFCARVLDRKTAERMAEQLLDIEHINIAAAKNYQPIEIFPGRITMFLTRRLPYLYPISPQDGWAPLAAGGLEIVEVPEDRGSSLEEVFSITVADRIRMALGSN